MSLRPDHGHLGEEAPILGVLADEVEAVLHVGEGEDRSRLGDLHAPLLRRDPTVDVVERATTLGVVLAGGPGPDAFSVVTRVTAGDGRVLRSDR